MVQDVNNHRQILLGLLLGVILVVFLADRPKLKAIVSPINESKAGVLGSFSYYDLGLAPLIDRDIQTTKGEYGILIESLSPDIKIRYFHNEKTVLPAASLYKLLLLATAYDQLNQGKITKNDQISASEGHLVDVLGSKEFGYEDLQGDNITYSISEILQRISNISDNYAAIMLAEKLGWDNVRLEAQNLGMYQTSVVSPITTTPEDIALFFRKLYLGQVVTPQASTEIIELLSGSRINDRIPAKLPASLKIAHKTGELPGVRNDAGLVFLDNKPYIIVLMSKDLQYEDDGVDTLANISGDVYNYFDSIRLP